MSRRQPGWTDYIAAVWRWRWYLLAAVLASGAGAWILSARMPRWFQATAVILPREIRTGGERYRGAWAFLGIRPSTATRDTFLAILTSRTLGRGLVRMFGLAGGLEGSAEEDAIDALGARMGIDVSKEGTIEITMKAETPERASAMANFYADSADRMYRNLRMGEGLRRSVELEAELHELTRIVRAAETDRQRWQEVSGIYDVSDYLSELLRGEETSDQQGLATGQRTSIGTSRSRSALSSGQRSSVVESTSIGQELLQILLPQTPEIKAETTGNWVWEIRSGLRDELDRGELVLESLRASRTDTEPEVVRLKKRLRGLARKIEEIDYGSGPREMGSSQIDRPRLQDPLIPLESIPGLDADAARLNRGVNLSVELATSIGAGLAAARIQESMDLPMSFVLDRAVPETRPVWPRPLRNLIVAIMGTLFGGIYIALVAAYIFRHAQEAGDRQRDHRASSRVVTPSK